MTQAGSSSGSPLDPNATLTDGGDIWGGGKGGKGGKGKKGSLVGAWGRVQGAQNLWVSVGGAGACKPDAAVWHGPQAMTAQQFVGLQSNIFQPIVLVPGGTTCFSDSTATMTAGGHIYAGDGKTKKGGVIGVWGQTSDGKWVASGSSPTAPTTGTCKPDPAVWHHSGKKGKSDALTVVEFTIQNSGPGGFPYFFVTSQSPCSGGTPTPIDLSVGLTDGGDVWAADKSGKGGGKGGKGGKGKKGSVVGAWGRVQSVQNLWISAGGAGSCKPDPAQWTAPGTDVPLSVNRFIVNESAKFLPVVVVAGGTSCFSSSTTKMTDGGHIFAADGKKSKKKAGVIGVWGRTADGQWVASGTEAGPTTGTCRPDPSVWQHCGKKGKADALTVVEFTIQNSGPGGFPFFYVTGQSPCA